MHLFGYMLVFVLVFVPAEIHAQEINAGFVQGLWYSSDQIIENVPIRIYAAFRNNTPHDLTGTIRFIDNGKRIGSAPVSALSGRLVETWIDWTPTYGDHNVSVTLSDAELHVIGGETIQVNVENITVSDTQLADRDADKDGVGDITDTDDDNDGVSDTEEIARGSDPFTPNPKPKESEETAEETRQENIAVTPPQVEAKDGLEKYLDSGIPDTLLGNVTEKVESAKQSLDAYREERNAKLSEKNLLETTSTSTGDATITRSKIGTNSNFLSSFVSGVAILLQNIWTFVLWVLSHILAHPAFVQLFLLVGILYIFYRTARRFGRRQY